MPPLMRQFGGFILLALCLLAGGCGSSHKSEITTSTEAGDNTAHPPTTQERGQTRPSTETHTTATTEVQTTPAQPPKQKSSSGVGGFTGQDARRYERAREVCATAPPQLSRSRRQLKNKIARIYAKRYRPAFRPAVEAGCRAGLR
jgi:hypothetical protein